MLKTVLAGTTALVIAGTALAYAHPGQGKGNRAQGWRPSAQDITAFGDARIAALKAGLALNADQEKLWPPVESAMRDLAKQRAGRVAARDQAAKPTNPIERLDRSADAMQTRGAALKKLAEAAGPLYTSLDDAQKRRFMVLARLGVRSGYGHRSWRGRHDGRGRGDRQHHRGPRGDGSRGPGAGPNPQ
jgi:hypothetical protein